MPPKRKPRSAKQRECVIIEVGPRCREFKVRKNLLMKHSEFFTKALQGTWKEATDGKVVLEDVRPAVFEVFVEWLSTGKIPQMDDPEDSGEDSENNDDDVDDDENEDKDENEGQDSGDEDNFCEDAEPCHDCEGCTETYGMSLVKAYILGDRFLAPLYKHALLDQLVEQMWEGLRPKWFHVIAYAYNNLAERDPMLAALVDIHCRFWRDGQLTKEEKEHAKLLPMEFWLATTNVWEEMCHEISCRSRGFFWKPLNPCEYHYPLHRNDSEEGKQCKKRWEAKVQGVRREYPWLADKP